MNNIIHHDFGYQPEPEPEDPPITYVVVDRRPNYAMLNLVVVLLCLIGIVALLT